MAEHYVRPPLVAREAPAAWLAVWRFRAAALLLLALSVLALVLLLRHFVTGADAQDPGVGARGPALTALL